LRSTEDEEALIVAAEALALARWRLTAGADPGVQAEPAPAKREEAEKTGRKKVLITGAGGRIGGDLAERLRDRYDLRLMHRRPVPETTPATDPVIADIADFAQVAAAMAGVDAVVHMAADPSTRAPWESVLEHNIVGTYNVFEAARRAGVRRVVFASTNHVMGMYDRDRQWPIYAHQPVRPDSLYGVSKAFGEALGSFYADQHGLGVICLRIGWATAEPMDDIGRWMWLSPRDCAQVVWRAIESDLRFGVFYAISGNGGRHWDITDTMERLGYRPEDDAERFFASS
jgi:nucleoside-diphosphate-sugar epimerase